MSVQPPIPQPPSPQAAKMDLGAYVSKAWALVTADLALFIVGYLVMVLIIVVSAITIVGPLIIAGPLAFGYLRIVQKRIKGEPAAIGDVFQGFHDFGKGFVTVLLILVCSLVVVIPLIIVNIILAFIPCVGQVIAPLLGIAVSLALQGALFFAMSIAALSDVQPMDAIKQSIKFCVANLWPVILLALVAGLIGSAGVIACGIGIFFTVPLGMAIGVIAYNDYYLPNASSVV